MAGHSSCHPFSIPAQAARFDHPLSLQLTPLSYTNMVNTRTHIVPSAKVCFVELQDAMLTSCLRCIIYIFAAVYTQLRAPEHAKWRYQHPVSHRPPIDTLFLRVSSMMPPCSPTSMTVWFAFTKASMPTTSVFFSNGIVTSVSTNRFVGFRKVILFEVMLL